MIKEKKAKFCSAFSSHFADCLMIAGADPQPHDARAPTGKVTEQGIVSRLKLWVIVLTPDYSCWSD